MTPSPTGEGSPSRQRGARLRLGLYAPGCLPGYHLPYCADVDGGEFTRRGLDVELSDPEGGLDTVRTPGEGRLDACITSVAHYLRTLQEDGSVAARFALMIARRTHLAAFVVETGNSFAVPTSLANLGGARLLGEQPSSFTREYLTVMRAAGVSPLRDRRGPPRTGPQDVAARGGRRHHRIPRDASALCFCGRAPGRRYSCTSLLRGHAGCLRKRFDDLRSICSTSLPTLPPS